MLERHRMRQRSLKVQLLFLATYMLALSLSLVHSCVSPGSIHYVCLVADVDFTEAKDDRIGEPRMVHTTPVIPQLSVYLTSHTPTFLDSPQRKSKLLVPSPASNTES